jgi:acyl carrier protein
LSLEEYVRLRGEDGAPLDPILRFHFSHGAEITRLLPAYRPADTDNNGVGVLIEYDLRRRQSNHVTLSATSDAVRTARDEVASFVMFTIQEVLGGAEDFSPTETLLDLGLDSMGMLELRTVLSRHFQKELDSTFLFEHDTATAIIDYLAR